MKSAIARLTVLGLMLMIVGTARILTVAGFEHPLQDCLLAVISASVITAIAGW